MKNLTSVLQNNLLFQFADEEQLRTLLQSLRARTVSCRKGERILRAGTRSEAFGILLNGTAAIESTDFWGNQTLISPVESGEIFAEVYVMIPRQPMLVDVTAVTECEVLFLYPGELLWKKQMEEAEEHFMRALLMLISRKNLNLTRRMFHTAPHTIRERLVAYLSDRAAETGSSAFEIPLDRQRLADYLGVDRSALSAEIGKMRREGLLVCRKNRFELKFAVPD